MTLGKFFNRAASYRSLKLSAIAVAFSGTMTAGVFKTKEHLLETSRQAWATQYPDNPCPAGNDPNFDAFRHAYTSARLTQSFGAAMAQVLMDGNEVIHINPLPERRKDAYNNDCAAQAWGCDSFRGFREVDAGLAGKINSALRGGMLKTDPAAVPKGYKHKSCFGFPGF